MKVTKKEANLIIILLGVIIIVLTYFYGVQKLNEKTEALNAENGQLRNEINALQTLQLKQKGYIEDTEMMKGMGEMIMAMFPSKIQTEDQIMYAVSVEDKIGCYFSYVGTPVTQLIEIPLGERENSLATVSDITGQIAAHSTVDPAQILSADGLMLGNSSSTNNFICTYDQFKELVKLITGNSDLRSINDISLSFDNSNGNLTGTMTINYFSMEGNGREYEAPQTGVNGHGVDCIFGAVVEESESAGDAAAEGTGEGEETAEE